VQQLDGIAGALGRDRHDIVNEALTTYVDTYQRQVDQIRQGLKEADAGEFASDADVNRVIARLRRM